MKRILTALLVLCLAGCNAAHQVSTSPISTSTEATALMGNWTGTITGKNFTGTIPIQFGVVNNYDQQGSQALGVNLDIQVSAMNQGCIDEIVTAPSSVYPTSSLVGSQFTTTNTSPISAVAPVGATFSNFSGAFTSATTLSGNVAFASPPCGFNGSYWVGSFTAVYATNH